MPRSWRGGSPEIRESSAARSRSTQTGPEVAITTVASELFAQWLSETRGNFNSRETPSGIESLENTVASVPKDKQIVLYCGCCPWNRCPNVGPAYKRLHDLGFTNVKVLYIANNFGDDWVNKGYPAVKGK